jgi:hypothetical protein
MATTGTYTFNTTLYQLVYHAMLNMGKLGEGEGPTAQEITDSTFKLNALIKQWQGTADMAPGLKMWTRRQGHLFMSTLTGQYQVGFTSSSNWTNSYTSSLLSANSNSGTNTITVNSSTGFVNGAQIGIQMVGTYQNGNLFWTTINGTPVGNVITLTNNLPANCLVGGIVYTYSTKAQLIVVPETCVLRDMNNEDVPINFFTVQDYQFFPSKTDPNYISDPVSVYVERNVNFTTLYFDVAGASDVSKHIVIEYQEPIQDITNPNDNPEFPQEWIRALEWGLTKEICPMFQSQWTPAMQSNYTEALSIARNVDPNRTSMYFQCNADSNQGW